MWIYKKILSFKSIISSRNTRRNEQRLEEEMIEIREERKKIKKTKIPVKNNSNLKKKDDKNEDEGKIRKLRPRKLIKYTK